MLRKNFYQAKLQPALFFGEYALFSDDRINRTTLLQGLYSYEIRAENGDICELGDSIVVDYYGTVITSKRINLPKEHPYKNIESGDMQLIAKKYYTINFIENYVFATYQDAVSVKKRLRQRFPAKRFVIYSIEKSNPSYLEYAKYYAGYHD